VLQERDQHRRYRGEDRAHVGDEVQEEGQQAPEQREIDAEQPGGHPDDQPGAGTDEGLQREVLLDLGEHGREPVEAFAPLAQREAELLRELRGLEEQEDGDQCDQERRGHHIRRSAQEGRGHAEHVLGRDEVHVGDRLDLEAAAGEPLEQRCLQQRQSLHVGGNRRTHLREGADEQRDDAEQHRDVEDEDRKHGEPEGESPGDQADQERQADHRDEERQRQRHEQRRGQPHARDGDDDAGREQHQPQCG
jgi:hypothetical protein